MKIIRLTDGQKKCARVRHPLLNDAVKISSDEFHEAREQMFNGRTEEIRKAGRDKIVLGHLHYVRMLVGRFLANWTETQRFEDDMVSEGLLAVTKTVDNLKADTNIDNFQGSVWWAIRDHIERMLNDCRSMFSPCRSKNYEMVDEGKDAEYNYAQNLREELDAGTEDDQLDWVDMLDDLGSFSLQDKESFRAVMLMCMERDHGLEEEDLTEKELEAINNVSKILGEM